MLREIIPYCQEPPAMPAGAPGKHGRLRLRFEQDGNGRSILRHLERRAPLIVQQALYFDEEWPQLPCVYILSSGGPNVDGDRYEQEICLERGACAHVATGAATKLAEMRYNHSALTQHLELDAEAYLEYLPEPVIPCLHARFVSDTRLTVHPTATLLYAEIFTGGRKHYVRKEQFAYDVLSITTHGERPDGEQLFREKLVIAPADHSPRALGVMADYDVFANVLLLTPPEQAEAVYQQTEAFIDHRRLLAAGVTRLPSACGLLYKVLGMESEPVKRQVRTFASLVRQQVKGRPLPREFPWRGRL
ncbi:MAG: urease accessory protein UreD [Bacteroides sp.]|nr:urease accessory protein UreD [Bacteroides sp.]